MNNKLVLAGLMSTAVATGCFPNPDKERAERYAENDEMSLCIEGQIGGQFLTPDHFGELRGAISSCMGGASKDRQDRTQLCIEGTLEVPRPIVRMDEDSNFTFKSNGASVEVFYHRPGVAVVYNRIGGPPINTVAMCVAEYDFN